MKRKKKVEFKKGILLSIAKNPRKSVYEFKKNINAINFIDKIVADLGINYDEYYTIKESFWNIEGNEKRNINKIKDEYFDLNSKKYLVDVFIGDKKIILVIHYRSDRQIEVSEVVNKYVDFKKSRKNRKKSWMEK